MKTILIYTVFLISLLSYSQKVTIEKGAPVATSVECWKMMNQAAIDNDQEYMESLIKEFCFVVLTK
ncbi:MAG: hypothetical protein ACPGRP_01860 [Flavobacteriaceae bacterium]